MYMDHVHAAAAAAQPEHMHLHAAISHAHRQPFSKQRTWTSPASVADSAAERALPQPGYLPLMPNGKQAKLHEHIGHMARPYALCVMHFSTLRRLMLGVFRAVNWGIPAHGEGILSRCVA